jgi:hypothetical protein
LVVWLGINPPDPGETELTIDLFRAGLRDLGYVDGRNIVVEYRHTNSRPERLRELIKEQIQQKVDVIMSARADILLAAMRATRSIPIVFAAVDDPVGAGLVDSLAKPGANVTGVAWDSTTKIAGKQFQLLRELRPGDREFAILWNPDVKGAQDFFREAQSAARTSALALHPFEVHSLDDLEAAFSRMASEQVRRSRSSARGSPGNTGSASPGSPHGIDCRRSTATAIRSRPAGSCPTDRRWRISFAALPASSPRSSRVPGQATCPSSSRRSSSW